jgi:hypothetical protein
MAFRPVMMMFCLLVLDSVTSTPQWIRQPRPRVYLKEGTYHTRLFRGPSTNDMKRQDGPSRSWPTPHTTPFFFPPGDLSPVLLRPWASSGRRPPTAASEPPTVAGLLLFITAVPNTKLCAWDP